MNTELQPEERLPPPPVKHFVFISYSRRNSAAARWLQRRLEWFHFPVKLVPEPRLPLHPRYLRPVYRDKTSLEVDPAHYWDNIRKAIDESRFMIVLCSPESAKSRPVDDEVKHFLASREGAVESLLPVVLSGRLRTDDDQCCLCPTLRDLGDTITGRNLPTMIPDAGDRESEGWENGFVAIVSFLLGVSREALSNHVRREQRRRTRVAWGIAALVTVLGVVAYLKSVEATEQRDIANQKRIEVITERDNQSKLLMAASHADHTSAVREAEQGRYSEALADDVRSLGYRPDNVAALVGSGMRGFGGLTPICPLRYVVPFEGKLKCIAYSPDGRYLAAANHQVSGLNEQFIHVLDATTGAEVRQIKSLMPVCALEFSADGSRLVVGATDADAKQSIQGSVRVLDAATGSEITFKQFAQPIQEIHIAPDGTWIAVGLLVHGEVLNIRGQYQDTSKPEATGVGLEIVDAANGQTRATAHAKQSVRSLSIRPDGKSIAAVGVTDFFVVDPITGKEQEVTRPEHSEEVPELFQKICYSPDGRLLAAHSKGKRQVVVFDVETFNVAFEVNGVSLTDVAFSQDGRWLAISSEDMTAQLISSSRPYNRHVGSIETSSPVRCLRLSPDGRWVAIGGDDGGLRVFEAAPHYGYFAATSEPAPDADALRAAKHTITQVGEQSLRFAPDAAPNEAVTVDLGSKILFKATTADEKSVMVACSDKSVRWLGTSKGDEQRRLVLSALFDAFALTNDASRLAVAKGGERVALIDLTNGSELARWLSPPSLIKHTPILVFSPDNQWLAADNEWALARVFNLRTKQKAFEFKYRSSITAMVFSTDSTRLAIAANESVLERHEAQLIDLRTGEARSLPGTLGYSFGFSRDSQWLATSVVTRSVDDWFGHRESTSLGVLHVPTVQMTFGADLMLQGTGPKFDDDGTLRASHWKTSVTLPWFRKPDARAAEVWPQALRTRNWRKFDPSNQLVSIPPNEHAHYFTALQKYVDAEAPAEEQWQHRVLRWARQLPESRTTSPWSTVLIRDETSVRLKSLKADDDAVRELATIVPWHPLIPIALARNKQEPFRSTAIPGTIEAKALLADLTLQRLRHASVKLYGKESLTDYAAQAAQWMTDLRLPAQAEAARALDF